MTSRESASRERPVEQMQAEKNGLAKGLPGSTIQIYAPKELENAKFIVSGTTSNVSVATLHGLKVAVKSLRNPDDIQDPSTRRRAPSDFEQEVLINSRLRHPNILLFIGCVRSKRLESLVFEYSKDGVVDCKKYGYSRVWDAVEICLGVGRALCFAHGLDIMHRDVKPSQVLMFGDVPKLGDWGLAKLTDAGEGHTGETGTWEFVSHLRRTSYSAETCNT